MIFHPRSTWKPAHGRGGEASAAMRRVVIHHAPERKIPANATVAQIAEQIRIMEDWHAKTLTPTNKRIGYHWIVVEQTGEVYEGLGWDRIGAHVKGHNTLSLGVLILGIHGDVSVGSDRTWSRIADIVREGIRRKSLITQPELSPHRRYVATSCPGDVLARHVEQLTLRELLGSVPQEEITIVMDPIKPRPPEVVRPAPPMPAIRLDRIVSPTQRHVDEIARVRRQTPEEIAAGLEVAEILMRGVIAARGGDLRELAIKAAADAVADWIKSQRKGAA